MTSLAETLPILDEAVPALPPKVDAVAREGDEFQQAAQRTLSVLREKRAGADALAEQVRLALAALREQARGEEERQEAEGRALQEMVEQESRGIEEAAADLLQGGEQAADSLGSLETRLEEAGTLTRAAHDDARVALADLAQEARSGQAELESAVDEVTAAVKGVEDAISEGQSVVTEGIATLRDAVVRLLAAAHGRLAETYRRLDEVQSGQQNAVTEAISALAAEREQLQKEVAGRLDTTVASALQPELVLATDALDRIGEQVAQLRSDAQAQRERLDEELTQVAERMPPLHEGVQQVKQAAERVGLDWP